MVKEFHADGGLIITSSHNPIEWNGTSLGAPRCSLTYRAGLKFVDRDTLFLSPEKCTELFAIADKADRSYKIYSGLGSMHEIHDASMRHINRILALPYIKPEEVRARKFTVCLDTVNGALCYVHIPGRNLSRY